MASQAQRGNRFPWWIVWIWSGVLAGLFYWLWKQRGKDSSIQPIQVDLSFLRKPSTPLPGATSPAEVLIAVPELENLPEKAPETPQPEPVRPDDLTLIHGIGPKIAKILREAGIDTFKSLAQSGPEALREVLQAAKINTRLADPESWPAQAQAASQGNWDESMGAEIRRRASRNS
jgi:predicted flap endonuclease-1-like 5' DNA nuclease